MSKCDIQPDLERGNRILIVKLQYSAQVRMSKKDFECQNMVFGPILNVKI